ncbi:MAG TPA: hypothetical protein VFA33_18660 [Bryobacteraceae bacterium]|nr:hypothetical protein [Bryobacteraceae bacterium]
MYCRRKQLLAGVLGAVAASFAGYAQDQPAPPPDRLFFNKFIGPGMGPVMMQGGVSTAGIQYVATEMGFEGNVVKGVPYSAQAVTETTQTLADGNRIHRTVTASVYRDGEGRTRREQSLAAIGPFGPPGDAPQTVFVNDPVAGTHYVLEPGRKIARKMPAPPSAEQREKMTARLKAAGASASGNRMYVVSRQGGAGEMGMAITLPAGGAQAQPQVRNESLGTQVIEGVQAEGTRTTMTIAAGQIGNARPIEVVSERWYSPDLQTVVMTKHSDPRVGETVYRLTNVSRGEPSPTLFQVPADYTVEEPPAMPMYVPSKPETK